MTATRCAAQILSRCWLLGLLVSCSIDKAGSGTFELSDDGNDQPDPADGELADDGEGDSVGDDDPKPGTEPGDENEDAEGDVDASVEDPDDDPDATSARCMAGRYEGTFECIPMPTIMGIGPVRPGVMQPPVMGSLMFTLAATDDSDELEVRDGRFTATSTAFVMVEAKITGTLTCGEPFVGELEDARYSNLIAVDVPFDSPFEARFDERASRFTDGTWQVDDANGTQCKGSWKASRVGP